MNKRFIGANDLAQYLGLSPKTVRAWVWQRKVPYHKLGGSIRFDLREIEPWLAKRKRKTILDI